ncbi:uncharacterized protein LOC115813708 isoform X3 [Chanos chanos]|uniref:Uncharacterized protein LOC115813708 isoform X3 n=1 Tax=Chanos chanos TaxID=29144 RepID=A0A6J2VLL1_CHACN|nr:uncharacterized protein LOC115813708 isoform X3 [Chanos chanos]
MSLKGSTGSSPGLMRVQDVHALHVKGQVRGQFQRITDGKSVNIYKPLVSMSFSGDCFLIGKSGFKASRSTEITLLAVIEELHLAKAKSLSSVLILLDLSTAFNTVNHQILLSALLGWALQDPHSHGSNPTSLNVPTRSLEGIGLLPPPFPDGGPTRFCTLPPKSNHVLQPV